MNLFQAMSVDFSLRRRFKFARRKARFYLILAFTRFIAGFPVSAIPKFRKFFLKISPVVFKREIARACQLLPDEFRPRREQIIHGMIENVFMHFLEVIFYEKLLEDDPDYISIVGRDILDRAMERGEGAVVLTAHFGAWELIGYTIARMGYPISVIARPQALNDMTEFVNSFRQSRGVEVLMYDNLSVSLKKLKDGGVVGIVSDLDASSKGYAVPFLGRQASFYPTPVLLSMRGKALLIPTFIERQSDCRHIIRFEDPVAFPAEETMAQRVSRYVSRYEEAFRARPDHWVWFHDRYRRAHKGRG